MAERIRPLACPNHGPVLAERVGEDGRREAIGTVSAVREGQDVRGRKLYAHEGNGYYREVELGRGPAQVATAAYRDGWDATFGNKSLN